MESERKKTPGAGKRRRWGRLAGRAALIPVCLLGAWLWFVWPPPAWYRWAWPRETAFMAMRRAEPQTAVRSYEPVPLSRIALPLKSAVLAGEDQRFYQHAGIDFVEFRHALGYRPDSFSWRDALWRALRQIWVRRGRIRGASTITQQLAKNLYLSPSRNPLRKLKEAITAWRLEYWLGKERILELYLNVVELGPGVWGAQAAARKYFGHGAATLSLEEAAALAGTLPFPLSSNLSYRPGRMRWRQSMILRRLRGEDVVIPPVPDLPDVPPEPLKATPDTIPDSLKVKPDSVIDTLPIPGGKPPAGGSGQRLRASLPIAAASPG